MESGASRQAMHVLASLERHVQRRNWGLDGTIGGEAGVMQQPTNAYGRPCLDSQPDSWSLQGPLTFLEA